MLIRICLACIQTLFQSAVKAYIDEINAGTFPGPEHTYKIGDEVIEKLY